jgi:hypothetical protein
VSIHILRRSVVWVVDFLAAVVAQPFNAAMANNAAITGKRIRVRNDFIMYTPECISMIPKLAHKRYRRFCRFALY